jgi:flagellar protein FlgJ
MMHPIAYARSAKLQEADTQTAGVDPRLKPAAHAFEASLLQELLKPMQKDPLFSDSSGQGGGLADGGMDTMSSLSTQALARAISDHGGLGLAAEVLQQVQAEKMRETQPQGGNPEKPGRPRTALPGRAMRPGEAFSGPLRRLP